MFMLGIMLATKMCSSGLPRTRPMARQHIYRDHTKGGLEELRSIFELSSAIVFLSLENAIALLSSEMLPSSSKPPFDPSRVICTEM